MLGIIKTNLIHLTPDIFCGACYIKTVVCCHSELLKSERTVTAKVCKHGLTSSAQLLVRYGVTREIEKVQKKRTTELPGSYCR